MRDDFVKTLFEQALLDEKILLITADLGFGIFDDFRRTLPEQFINVGIAEQNLIGFAAGLSFLGFRPFVYSIAPFVTLRCFEQIRNDLSYHNASVVVVGSGGGFTYGQLGFSHHALEDIAVMRTLPSVEIYVPACSFETTQIVRSLAHRSGTSYLRIEKNNYNTEKASPEFQIGKARKFFKGEDLFIFSTGGLIEEINGLVGNQFSKNITVFSFHRLDELDPTPFKKALKHDIPVLVVEEHRAAGGFSEACLSLFASLGSFPNTFKALNVPNVILKIVGDQQYLRSHCRIDAETVRSSIEDILWKNLK